VQIHHLLLINDILNKELLLNAEIEAEELGML
jgi:hypothetical protein